MNLSEWAYNMKIFVSHVNTDHWVSTAEEVLIIKYKMIHYVDISLYQLGFNQRIKNANGFGIGIWPHIIMRVSVRLLSSCLMLELEVPVEVRKGK